MFKVFNKMMKIVSKLKIRLIMIYLSVNLLHLCLRKKKENVTPFQNSLLYALKNPPTTVEDDSDKQFLLSFLPGIKRFTEDQKMEFKFQFHQLYRNFIRSITAVPQATHIHPNYSNSTNITNTPYQMQHQYFSQNTPAQPQQSIGQQENYRTSTPQPSSSRYINQQPYQPPLHTPSFSSFPLLPSAFLSTGPNQSAPYSSVPITQEQDRFYNNDDTVDSI